MTFGTVLENIVLKMEIAMMEPGKMIKALVPVYIHLQMVKLMRAIFWMANSMVQVHSII